MVSDGGRTSPPNPLSGAERGLSAARIKLPLSDAERGLGVRF